MSDEWADAMRGGESKVAPVETPCRVVVWGREGLQTIIDTQDRPTLIGPETIAMVELRTGVQYTFVFQKVTCVPLPMDIPDTVGE